MAGTLTLDASKRLILKGFVLAHLNVCSLLRHMDESFYYLGGSDIICFAETWLRPRAEKPLLLYQGYDYLRQDHEYGVQGGGLIMNIKESLMPFINTISECSYSDVTTEEMWISLDQPCNKKMIISLIYRPPTGNICLFEDRLKSTLRGDFNVNFLKTQDPQRNRLKITMGDMGLLQVIKKLTRVTNTSRSTIDLIFTNIGKPLLYMALWPTC